ncbi:MAG: class I SAM-dependent methyltransferase [Sphingobacteriales bacterium]|jgi:2-polyprenyl-3-methyl-5-hydroxy-6-metoxy-1,4-benzoquinol methylase|nr:class I SAM-dependent methyltransferase [Sphingobacteriales bacterium]
MNCLLCHTPENERIHPHFFQCKTCRAIYKNRQYWLNPDEEKARYLLHKNDIYDPNYRRFVSLITDAVLAQYTPQHQGLDFGAGTGPVIAQVLAEHGFQVKLYDPFFHPFQAHVQAQYDYIMSCEVVEHFHNPAKEFQLLHGCLKEGAKLFIMTDRFNPSHTFENWYYKNDPTHVFIYQDETFEWIQAHFGFSALQFSGRLVSLQK